MFGLDGYGTAGRKSGPIASGEPKSHGKSPFFMGKTTISMAIFNSFLYSSPEGSCCIVLRGVDRKKTANVDDETVNIFCGCVESTMAQATWTG